MPALPIQERLTRSVDLFGCPLCLALIGILIGINQINSDCPSGAMKDEAIDKTFLPKSTSMEY